MQPATFSNFVHMATGAPKNLQLVQIIIQCHKWLINFFSWSTQIKIYGVKIIF